MNIKKRLKKIIIYICLVAILGLGYQSVVEAKEYTGSGILSNNIHDHVYTDHAKISNSYIITNPNNTFTRIENYGDVILVETYNSSFKLVSQATIGFHLSKFGGFYAASNYYYFVFGQDNYEQDDSKEVIRIIQYTREWEHVKTYSIRGCNTTVPFDGCNSDFAEVDDTLYYRCGHQTYKDKNGNYSYGPMTISINQERTQVYDVQSSVLGEKYGSIADTGATYIDGSDGVLTAVDHSKTSPYAAVTSAYANSSKSTYFESTCLTARSLGSVIGTNGYHADFTIGGYEVASQYNLIVGTQIPIDGSSNARNIVIMAVPRNEFTDAGVKLTFLTGFAVGDAMTADNPFIVPITTDKYMVLWEQRVGYSDTEKVYYTYIDGSGNRLTDVNSIDGCLSDCQPVIFNNQVIWYTTDASSVKLYSISLDDKQNKASSGSSVYNNTVNSSMGIDYSKIYDFSYYCSRYPDVRVLYSNDPDGAFRHFVNTGISEGRQGSADFNLSIYKANYPDLQNAYGDDKWSYYYHYMVSGYYDGRNARTYN